mmetsp:Transcript_16779/g.36847  ORF Transcript_16779/g.36847 Transcript_16779/m.36847 type:complete len:300 (-) Transcript_16779:1434-2333(-)
MRERLQLVAEQGGLGGAARGDEISVHKVTAHTQDRGTGQGANDNTSDLAVGEVIVTAVAATGRVSIQLLGAELHEPLVGLLVSQVQQPSVVVVGSEARGTAAADIRVSDGVHNVRVGSAAGDDVALLHVGSREHDDQSGVLVLEDHVNRLVERGRLYLELAHGVDSLNGHAAKESHVHVRIAAILVHVQGKNNLGLTVHEISKLDAGYREIVIVLLEHAGIGAELLLKVADSGHHALAVVAHVVVIVLVEQRLVRVGAVLPAAVIDVVLVARDVGAEIRVGVHARAGNGVGHVDAVGLR